MLFAIGAGPQVVAVSSFDTYPPEVAPLPRVGALLDPDVERVMSLAPDLVAIYGTQTDLKRQLERAAIPVFDYRHGGLADVFATIRALGRAHRPRLTRRARWPTGSNGASTRSASGPPGGPGAACCWSSAARWARCGTSTPAAGAASCTTC